MGMRLTDRGKFVVTMLVLVVFIGICYIESIGTI
jgi:hypothetical protein